MSTPTTKDPQLEHLFAKLGFNRTDAITGDRCVMCHKPAPPKSFRDIVSEREFRISGMCQTCQDITFN